MSRMLYGIGYAAGAFWGLIRSAFGDRRSPYAVDAQTREQIAAFDRWRWTESFKIYEEIFEQTGRSVSVDLIADLLFIFPDPEAVFFAARAVGANLPANDAIRRVELARADANAKNRATMIRTLSLLEGPSEFWSEDVRTLRRERDWPRPRPRNPYAGNAAKYVDLAMDPKIAPFGDRNVESGRFVGNAPEGMPFQRPQDAPGRPEDPDPVSGIDGADIDVPGANGGANCRKGRRR